MSDQFRSGYAAGVKDAAKCLHSMRVFQVHPIKGILALTLPAPSAESAEVVTAVCLDVGKSLNDREIIEACDEMFSGWWSRDGQYLDPDTSDVPWYDKRKGLAHLAFNAAMGMSGNYVADKECEPTIVTFTNGRAVSLSPITQKDSVSVEEIARKIWDDVGGDCNTDCRWPANDGSCWCAVAAREQAQALKAAFKGRRF